MTWDEICRRAGGRRRYNAQRQFAVLVRRMKVEKLMNDLEAWFTHGAPARIARILGVSRSTVCRDLRWLERTEWWAQRPGARRPARSANFLARLRAPLDRRLKRRGDEA